MFQIPSIGTSESMFQIPSIGIEVSKAQTAALLAYQLEVVQHTIFGPLTAVHNIIGPLQAQLCGAK